MGWTQLAWPLCAAMISFSRQIGLLGAVQGVAGTGLGDQLYQILASCWATAGPQAAAMASAAPNAQLRNFIKILHQTHVLAGETMSCLAGQDNRSDNKKPHDKRTCKCLPDRPRKL